jgi:hypothetical protein
LRFGASPDVEAFDNFLFVPPGEVTVGALVTIDVGDITRSGERLVDETTLAVFTEVRLSLDGCTVGATGSLISNITVRLLKDVEGRNAPNPSSISSFLSSVGRSEEPNSDGISTSRKLITSLKILREHKKSLDLLPEAYL